MPSGSHGGGGGSHSSGGSRGGGGGSHSGGGHYGGGHRGPRGPRHFHFGRRYYIISTRRQSAISGLVILAIFSIFVIFIGIALLAAGNQEISTIRADYDYYQNMIAFAEAHPDDYIRTGKVTDRFLSNNCSKYYITYSLQTDAGETLSGYTYSVYTLEEASRFVINSPIQIAVNSVPVTMQTDSITMDYKNMPIEKDGEYLNAKTQQNTGLILVIATASVFALSIVLAVWLTFAKRDVKQQQSANAAQPAAGTTAATYTYCNYCGAKLSRDDRKCSNCGANTR